jgi:hypothetical protein
MRFGDRHAGNRGGAGIGVNASARSVANSILNPDRGAGCTPRGTDLGEERKDTAVPRRVTRR